MNALAIVYITLHKGRNPLVSEFCDKIDFIYVINIDPSDSFGMKPF